jgi:hypothetical protein
MQSGPDQAIYMKSAQLSTILVDLKGGRIQPAAR